jgi:hypothetical protein
MKAIAYDTIRAAKEDQENGLVAAYQDQRSVRKTATDNHPSSH